MGFVTVFAHKIFISLSVDNSKLEASGVNGSIKDSLEKILKPDSSPVASARKNIIIKDDPNCPFLFKVEKLKKKSDPGERSESKHNLIQIHGCTQEPKKAIGK